MRLMNERKMRLNENDLKAMVAECVKRILKEESSYESWRRSYYNEAEAMVDVEPIAEEVFAGCDEGEDYVFLQDLKNIYKQVYGEYPKSYSKYFGYSRHFDGTYLFVYGHFYGNPEDPKIDVDTDETLGVLRDNLNQLVDKYEEERIDAFFNEVSALIEELTADDFDLIHGPCPD